MGYSIAAPCQNVKLRDKMHKFLQEHYRPWTVIRGGDQEERYATLPEKDGLSYHQGKCYIGFDYGVIGGGEREHVYTVVRWVALKIGKTNPWTKLPYYVYDGHETVNLLTEGDSKPDHSTIDVLGVPRQTPGSFKIRGVWALLRTLAVYDEEDALDVIRAEMQRLDDLWEAQ